MRYHVRAVLLAGINLVLPPPTYATGWGVNGASVLSPAQAARITGAVQASGGDASQTMVTAAYSGVGQTEQQRVSRVLDMAELGARGDATSDTAAFQAALALAQSKTSVGTTIHFGPGVWALASPGAAGFGIPSSTTVEGAGMDSTTLTWNDATDKNGSGGANLFAAALDSNNRAHDITFRGFRVRGTWDTNSVTTANSYPFIVYAVDNLTFDHIASDYARTIALVARNSTNVTVSNSRVRYSARDGINLANCTDMSVVDNVVEHTDDDSIALHSATGEPWGARRNILVTGNRVFDAQGIKVLSARSAVITGNLVDTFRGQGIDVESVPPNGSSFQEGVSAGNAILITGNMLTNPIDRKYVDDLNEGAPYIVVAGASARAGTYTGVPGTPGTDGLVKSPYAEFMANSTATATPTAGTRGIVISGNFMGRMIPPTDGSDARFKTWTDLGFGTIMDRTGAASPSVPLAGILQHGIILSGGVLDDMLMTDNVFEGVDYALVVGSVTDIGNTTFRGNTITDASGSGVLLNTAAKGRLTIEDNRFDLDPYFTSSGRGSNGKWVSGGPDAIYAQTSANLAVDVLRNTFRNLYADSNVDSSSPPSNWTWRDNILLADPNSAGAYDGLNKGVGFARPSAGTILQQTDSDPTSSTYGQSLTPAAYSLAGMPSMGKWLQGTVVWNNATFNAACSGYVRQTTGTSNALNIDWACMPVLNGGNLILGSNKAVVFQDATTGKYSYLGMDTTGWMSLNVSAKGDGLSDWKFDNVQVSQKLYLDTSRTMWVTETAGKVVIGTGTTNLFSIDGTGNVIAKGTVTQNGSP